MNNESNQPDREWAMMIVGRAMTRLRVHCVRNGQGDLFIALQDYLGQKPVNGEYKAIGARFSMREQAVAMAVSRLRQSFKELLCDELRRTGDGEK